MQSRIKALDKIEKIELPKRRQVVKFEFRVPPRSGDQVAVLENLRKGYGPRVIYDGFDLTIRRGERWAEVLLLTPSVEGTRVDPAASIKEVRALLEAGLSIAEAALPRTVPSAVQQLPLKFE